MYLLLLTLGCIVSPKDAAPKDTGRDDPGAGCEICDGEDNDGDGLIDEDFGDGDADGIVDCLDEETCDGFDNDGDGDIDESFADTDGDALADCVDREECDGLDNDADGSIDEDFVDYDGDGAGDCDIEDLCDGQDNNGDGRVDEGYPDTDGDGLANCLDPEECDGQDNDGDGEIDEGFDADGDGTADCFQEACNCADDDGDGEVDEGLDCTYDVTLSASADDTMTVYFDGVAQGSASAWRTLYTQTFSTTAGTHHLSVDAADISGVIAGFNARVEVSGHGATDYDTGTGAWRVAASDPANISSSWRTGGAATSMSVDSAFTATSYCDSTWTYSPSGADWIWAESCERWDQQPKNWFYLEVDVCPDAASEVCDGQDNDRDGLVDEGYSDSDFDGTADCLEDEACDGWDNNGDGLIDEGYADTDGDGIADCMDDEKCDGLDNDGDGLADNGFADTDGDGIADCVDEETCDGLDNDGDGAVDENYPTGDADEDGVIDCADGEECDGRDNDGDGVADDGYADTDADGIADCVDEETCDGLDNNGDGNVDEGWGDSDADGVVDCLDPEDCDGVDNDGDGLVDEEYLDTDADGLADCMDEESCDGLDNDGDGETDEGYPDADLDGVADCMDVELCNCEDDDGDGGVDEGMDCSYDVTMLASADDTFEAWLDGDAWGSGNNWRVAETLTASLPAGTHTIAVRTGDLYNSLVGFNASVEVPGADPDAWNTGLGLWQIGDTDPTATDPNWMTEGSSLLADDDAFLATTCALTWGAGPSGGDWVSDGDCSRPGDTDNYLFLEFEVCPTPPTDADGDGVTSTTDCDDSDATVYPGAPELCDDGADNDCEPTTDCEGLCAEAVQYDGACATEPDYMGPTPILYWNLDGASTGDRTGNGYDGAVTGAFVQEDGVVGTAALLDGASYAETTTPYPTNWTMSQWVRADALNASSTSYIASLGNGSTDFTGWGVVLMSDGRPGAYVESGIGSQETMLNDSEPVCMGGWVHLVATWESGTLTLYVDGELANQVSPFATIRYGSEQFFVGFDHHQLTRYFHGALDEMALWDTALNADEVAALFYDGACHRTSGF